MADAPAVQPVGNITGDKLGRWLPDVVSVMMLALAIGVMHNSLHGIRFADSAHPNSSWEPGANENTRGQIRQYHHEVATTLQTVTSKSTTPGRAFFVTEK